MSISETPIEQNKPSPLRRVSPEFLPRNIETARAPLDEIATRLARLTYGELKEFAGGTDANIDAIWDWAVRRAGA